MKEASQSLLPYLCVTSIVYAKHEDARVVVLATSVAQSKSASAGSATLLPWRRQSERTCPSSHTFRESFYFEPPI